MRISVDFPAKLTCERKQYQYRAREFSEFGILLVSKNKELVGKDVDLELNLDSPEASFSLQGVVAYATDTGLGVRFKNLTREAQAVLRNYIQTHGARTANNPPQA